MLWKHESSHSLSPQIFSRITWIALKLLATMMLFSILTPALLLLANFTSADGITKTVTVTVSKTSSEKTTSTKKTSTKETTTTKEATPTTTTRATQSLYGQCKS